MRSGDNMTHPFIYAILNVMVPFSQWISFLREDALLNDHLDFFHTLSEHELRAAYDADIDPDVINTLAFLENNLAIT